MNLRMMDVFPYCFRFEPESSVYLEEAASMSGDTALLTGLRSEAQSS